MRVGSKFPNISVKAINADGDELKINLSSPQIPTVLFWYPKDFTFVCPTELHAFQSKLKDFNNRGYQVIGASCDTAEVHFAWLNTPKDEGGIEGVEFPLLADSRRKLAKKLSILDYETEYFQNEDDDDDDEKHSSSNSSSGWRSSRRSSHSNHKTVNNYYQDDTPKGPRIYRYKVTINIDEAESNNTNVRVSASGELEQDGKILESGGIHEPEFFKRFFASMNKSIFLDENLPPNQNPIPNLN